MAGSRVDLTLDVSQNYQRYLQRDDHNQPVNKFRVDQIIIEMDRALSQQMDQILHQPQFQQLESA